MNQRTTLIIGAIFAGVAVAIGAFGAHGLKAILIENNREGTFELGVRYHFYHSFALLITGLLMLYSPSKKLQYASICFAVGIFIFSGSLYILSLTQLTILGAITPIGGLAFILGWLFLTLGIKSKASN